MNRRFLNVIKSSKPVLVDFYSDWCRPCQKMMPVLKEVKDEFKSNIRILKVNVDRNPHIATRYDINSIPSLLIFRSGKLIWKGKGIKPAGELIMILKEQIGD